MSHDSLLKFSVGPFEVCHRTTEVEISEILTSKFVGIQFSYLTYFQSLRRLSKRPKSGFERQEKSVSFRFTLLYLGKDSLGSEIFSQQHAHKNGSFRAVNQNILDQRLVFLKCFFFKPHKCTNATRNTLSKCGATSQQVVCSLTFCHHQMSDQSCPVTTQKSPLLK